MPARIAAQSSFLRFVISPLVAISIIQIIPMDQLTRQVFFVESVVPIAVFTIILSDIFHCQPQKASALVFWNTILAILVLPLWIVFIMKHIA